MATAIPEGYPSVRPYLHVDRAADAIDFYEEAFGARERVRLEMPGGKIAHAEIEIADSLVMLCDPLPRPAPQNAAVVNMPRLFADPATGAIDGLQNAPPTPQHPSGAPWGPTPITDACHDITTYPAIGLAAGACEGNGLLLDISDPANPVRIDAVADPNYAYWHGATFSNDGTKVVFTDEWGGGTTPRCRAADQLDWGANAIFDIVDRKLVFRSYYKMPAVQTNQENCVAHLPSLVPVPGCAGSRSSEPQP